MTRPNFAKLQILHTIHVLNRVHAPANSVTIASELEKTVEQTASSLKNLAKYHYIRKIPDGHHSCCYRYILLKEGKSVLKKLKDRAMRCLELHLCKRPDPRNYTEQEILWLKKAFPKSCQESPHPALNNITQSPDQREFFCVILGEKTTHCLTTFCEFYRECQHKTPVYAAKKQALILNKLHAEPQCCVTLPSDTITQDQSKSQIREP